MEKKKGLIHKIKHLLRKASAPRFLHHFGPKTYELWQHVLGLFVKAYSNLSYRRTTQLLRGLNVKVATKSTLQRYSAKLRLPFWQTLFKHTVGKVTNIGAIDGTCLERTRVSWHYIKRIGQKPMKQGFHLSFLVGTNNKILSLRLRSKLAHDIRDVKYLYNKTTRCPSTILLDKGYDAEWLHKFFHEKKVKSIAPVRKGIAKGFYRKNLKRKFPKKLYNKRNIVESTFHAFKQKFGASVSSKLANTARTEIYTKAILYNLSLKTLQLLGLIPLLDLTL